MAKKWPKKKPRSPFTMRFIDALRARVERVAESEQRTLTQMIELLLDEALRRREEEARSKRD
jgi:hypothetical protein